MIAKQQKWGFIGALVALACLILCGCNTKPLKDPILGPNYQVRNVYRREYLLPVNIRRVAVLPLSIKQPTADFISGKRNLEPVFHGELAKAARFETVLVEPTQLKQWTGRESWDAYEDLPPRLFQELAQRTGAEAVLFAHLTEYKAYPPIAIGWRMKLVDTNAQAIWAMEELFDASAEAVANAARRHDRAGVKNSPVLEDSRSILLSPTRFGQYTLQAVLETIPSR